MTVDQNKEILRRLNEEVWSKGQTNLISQFFAPDVCEHTPMPGQPRGLEGERWFVETFRRACPDVRVKTDLQVGEGDYVADHWTATGTMTGEFMGMPAPNKKFTMSGASLTRFSGGKIAEIWGVADELGMLQQVGLAPVPQGMPQETGRRQSSTQTNTQTSRGTGGGTFTPNQKRDLIRQAYREFIDKGNLANVAGFLTPDYTGHFTQSQTIHGLDEFKKFLEMYNQALSNQRADVEHILVDGDYAACLVRFTGKHTGRLGDLEPTNKQVDNLSVSLFHFRGDKVDEQWATNDDMTMMQQIGAIPEAAVAKPEPC